jgi:hypothetical protein
MVEPPGAEVRARSRARNHQRRRRGVRHLRDRRRRAARGVPLLARAGGRSHAVHRVRHPHPDRARLPHAGAHRGPAAAASHHQVVQGDDGGTRAQVLTQSPSGRCAKSEPKPTPLCRVRSFYYARTTVRSQGSSTTASRSDTTIANILTPRLPDLVRRWRS